MTTYEMAQKQVKYFEALYGVFKVHFNEALRKDGSVFNRVALHHSAHFFDDLGLQDKINALPGTSTLEQKRATARAAMYDALVEHTFSQTLSDSADTLHQRMNELEDKALPQIEIAKEAVAKVENFSRQSVDLMVSHFDLLKKRCDELERRLNKIGSQKQNAISKGPSIGQTSEGKKENSTDSVGSGVSETAGS